MSILDAGGSSPDGASSQPEGFRTAKKRGCMRSRVAQKVVIVGGGFGGVFTARHLQRLTGGRIDITLISQHNFFVFQPLLPEVAGGGIHPSDAVIPLRLFLPGIDVQVAEVRKIDLPAKAVHVTDGAGGEIRTVAYDHLVIALGQVVDLSRTPGLAERALVMKDVADAFRIRNHVLGCLEQADATTDARRKQRLLTFVVIGGGFTGIEVLGEMQQLITSALRFYPHIGAHEIRITVVQHGERILPELADPLAAYAAEALRRRGIEILLKTGVKAVPDSGIETDTGRTLDAETIIAAIGNAPSPLVRSLPLPLERGQIVVDRYLRVSGTNDVWALGDNARIPLNDPADGTVAYAPALAQFAYQAAKVLARNLDANIAGQPLTPFTYRLRGSMASLGGRCGVAEIKGVRITGFLAWAIWRAFYLCLLPTLSTRIRVATDWALDLFVRRSLVELRSSRPLSGPLRFFAGDLVLEPGIKPIGLYVISAGTFSAENISTAQQRQIGPGDWFGLAFRGREETANERIRASDDARVYFVAADDLHRLATVRALLHGQDSEAAITD